MLINIAIYVCLAGAAWGVLEDLGVIGTAESSSKATR